MTERRFAVAVNRAAIVVIGVSLLTACGTSSKGDFEAAESNSESSRLFWDSFRPVGASEAESFESISDMTQSADAVVRGNFSDFRSSRIIQGDATEDVVTYAIAELDIDDVLHGEVLSRPVQVEFMLFTAGPGVQSRGIEELGSILPEQELVVFLREKGGKDEAGLYRLVNSTGLWTSTQGGEGLTAPLSEEYLDQRSPYSEEVFTLENLDSFAQYIDEMP